MTTVIIYKLSIWLNSTKLKIRKKKLVVKETPKTYSNREVNVHKSDINKIKTNLLDTHSCYGYYAFCFPENESMVIAALKQTITERVMKCKEEMDGVLSQFKKIDETPVVEE